MLRSSTYDDGRLVPASAGVFARFLIAAFVIVLLPCVSATGQSEPTALSQSDNAPTASQILSSVNGKLRNAGISGLQQPAVAATEPTQAEKVKEAEQAFQTSLEQIKGAVASLEARINALRRDATPPPAQDLERVERDLNVLDNELADLATLATSPLAELQRSEVQDSVFKLRMQDLILKQRWEGAIPVFGMDFFRGASQLPELGSWPVPRNYRARVGDKLCVTVSSSIGEQNDYHLVIDAKGTIRLPSYGQLLVTGKTAAEIDKMAEAKLLPKFKQLVVSVAVEDLCSIRVQVTGEVARPGTYVLSGLSTVISALYKAGGPAKSGSFRHVTLERDGEPRRTIDLYDFLMHGQKKQDAQLEDGDLLFVPPVGATFTVAGEVVRPGRFEADFPLTLAGALKIAGGPKPTGYTQNVQVERVQNGEYKVLLREAVNGTDGKAGVALQSGDEITVISVSPDRTNQVTISGPVQAPGMYGYSENMRVSDLVKLAQGISPSKEVYGGRADVLRISPLKGTEIISFNLDKALKHEPDQDISLGKLDRVFIYSPDQVVFRPTLVTVAGLVARPGVYKRTTGMRIGDVIAAAGGVLPQAYLKRADLVRRGDSETTVLQRVDLQAALNGDPTANIELRDRDELKISSQSDVNWQRRTVRIEGAVQRPGDYERSDNMRASDLLFAAGGILPEAGDKAELARSTGTLTKVQSVALNGSSSSQDSDPLLMDRDVLTVPAVNSYLRTPPIVNITGEVARPGPYALLNDNEKLSDVIARAGGLTPSADTHGMLFLRQKESFENVQQQRDADLILATSRMFSDKQYVIELAKLGTTLPGQLPKSGSPLERASSAPGEVVPDHRLDQATSSTGQEPGAETQLPTKEGKMTGPKLSETSGLEPSAMGAPVAEVKDLASDMAGKNLDLVMSSARISVDLSKAMQDEDSPDNIVMRRGDTVLVPKKSDVVIVIGSVSHPHSFAAGGGKSVDFYIERSGGFAQDAAKDQVIVVRANGDALPKRAVKSVEPGDMIVVPNTGLINTAKKWERMTPVTKVISDILSSAYILTRF